MDQTGSACSRCFPLYPSRARENGDWYRCKEWRAHNGKHLLHLLHAPTRLEVKESRF
jgi:hypothetical protein